MNTSYLNYTFFFIVLFLIIIFSAKDNVIKQFFFPEKFMNDKMYHQDFSQQYLEEVPNGKEYTDIYYRIKNPLVSRINPFKTNDMVGWREHYKRNNMKDLVDNCHNFRGTIFRNYLDNMKFYLN